MDEKVYIVMMDQGIPLDKRVAPCWTLLDIWPGGLVVPLTYYRNIHPNKKIGFAVASSADWLNRWVIK